MSDFTRFNENAFTSTAFGLSVGAGSIMAASSIAAIAGIRERAERTRAARQAAMEAHLHAALRLGAAHRTHQAADQELRAALEDAGIPYEE